MRLGLTLISSKKWTGSFKKSILFASAGKRGPIFPNPEQRLLRCTDSKCFTDELESVENGWENRTEVEMGRVGAEFFQLLVFRSEEETKAVKEGAMGTDETARCTCVQTNCNEDFIQQQISAYAFLCRSFCLVNRFEEQPGNLYVSDGQSIRSTLCNSVVVSSYSMLYAGYFLCPTRHHQK
jgi:hypothetical protein